MGYSFATYERVSKFMFDIFWKGVQSVQIPRLINQNIHYDKGSDVLKVFDFVHNLKGKNVHLIGAGKAVYHMGIEIEKILGSKLKSGIVSVPLGILKNGRAPPNSVIEYYEGAQNNLPDELAERTTKKIIKYVSELDQNCLLMVLLSGGGSALLTAPIPPITLNEKLHLINNLAKAGADIVELNTVRKRLSLVKGGKLGLLAQPAEVISLLLSDIVSNQAASIASGPTFLNDGYSEDAMNVIKKYSLEEKLPTSVISILSENIQPQAEYSKVENYVLGNNTLAIAEVKEQALKMDYLSIITSDCIHGNLVGLSSEYCELVTAIIRYLSGGISESEVKDIINSLRCISFTDSFINEIISGKGDIFRKVCIIGGGEPTVRVTGRGKGGRSQQLALKFSQDIHLKASKLKFLNDYDIYILCAGTDGIDGPTDAAGAIGHNRLISDALSDGISVDRYLENNDSYNFYREFCGGKFHVMTGHTNTNVMDLHIIVIEPKSV